MIGKLLHRYTFGEYGQWRDYSASEIRSSLESIDRPRGLNVMTVKRKASLFFSVREDIQMSHGKSIDEIIEMMDCEKRTVDNDSSEQKYCKYRTSEKKGELRAVTVSMGYDHTDVAFVVAARSLYRHLI